jgi:hypothetical protein
MPGHSILAGVSSQSFGSRSFNFTNFTGLLQGVEKMKSNFRKLCGLALLVFAIAAIPALSHADAISTGGFTSGTISRNPPLAGSNLIVSITGPLGTISVTTGSLTALGPIFMFTGGSITATDASGTFHDVLVSGFITPFGPGNFAMTAELQTMPPTLSSGNASLTFLLAASGPNLVTGGGNLSFVGMLTPIPEPGTLGMLGTGLIGLAGLLRRKLPS